MIKNKNVHVAYKNNLGQNQIGYQSVKNYNRNGKRFFSSNQSNWLNYIRRKNTGTVNLFRKKIAVKKIEKAYEGKANPLFLKYKKVYQNKPNIDIIKRLINSYENFNYNTEMKQVGHLNLNVSREKFEQILRNLKPLLKRKMILHERKLRGPPPKFNVKNQVVEDHL